MARRPFSYGKEPAPRRATNLRRTSPAPTESKPTPPMRPVPALSRLGMARPGKPSTRPVVRKPTPEDRLNKLGKLTQGRRNGRNGRRMIP